MKLFNIIVIKQLGDLVRICDVTGANTLSAAKISMKTLYDAFSDDGYALIDSKSLSDSYSWLVFKKKNVTYEVQLTKAII